MEATVEVTRRAATQDVVVATGDAPATALAQERSAESASRLARAEERNRTAREIHDTLAQDLAAIGFDIERAIRHLDDRPETSRETLEHALATTQLSLDEARRSLIDLRAGLPSGQSLGEAIEELARSLESEPAMRVRARMPQTPALSFRVEADLYRIAQRRMKAAPMSI